MLRDKSLIPLSRQHQHALALCVRLERASPIRETDVRSWQEEIAQQFEQEIKFHFAAEERVLFPIARSFSELQPLVDELQAEHAALRQLFSRAETFQMPVTELSVFARRLSAHIRKEERQLFESMQELVSREELAALGIQLEDALKEAAQVCALPTETTRLKTKK